MLVYRNRDPKTTKPTQFIPIVPRRAGGWSFKGDWTLLIKSHRATNQCEAQTEFFVGDVPSGGVLVVASFVSLVVMWCAVVWCRMMPRSWFWSDVRTGNVIHVVSCNARGWTGMGCSVMCWDVVVWCVAFGDGGLWATVSPCHSKTFETSIPKRGATLGCKTQKTTRSPCHKEPRYVLQCSSPVLQSTRRLK